MKNRLILLRFILNGSVLSKDRKVKIFQQTDLIKSSLLKPGIQDVARAPARILWALFQVYWIDREIWWTTEASNFILFQDKTESFPWNDCMNLLLHLQGLRVVPARRGSQQNQTGNKYPQFPLSRYTCWIVNNRSSSREKILNSSFFLPYWSRLHNFLVTFFRRFWSMGMYMYSRELTRIYSRVYSRETVWYINKVHRHPKLYIRLFLSPYMYNYKLCFDFNS